MSKKQCIECKKDKERDDYVKKYKNGVEAEYNVCIECRRNFMDTKKKQ